MPSEFSFDEVQEYFETAHAFIMTWAMEDKDARDEIARNFIAKYIDNGDADLMIYALTAICVYTVAAVCKHSDHDLDLIETLQMANLGRLERLRQMEEENE